MTPNILDTKQEYNSIALFQFQIKTQLNYSTKTVNAYIAYDSDF